ncbi:MAG: trypsin-like peptidase domain-containing protein, partial [Myxococcota bacterium]
EGSGVVIDASGIVLTNAHVVEGARAITVTSSTGSAWTAQVVALEQDTDLAVLRVVGAPKLPTIELGSSTDLMLGEPVIAIGNPLGLGLTVSTGVVSSIDRDVEIRSGLHQTFIQTDAAINPGNSGGALVNIDGQLIGINTAIRADAQGIGFAIPVDRATKIAGDLVNYGSIRAPWLGIELVDLDARRLQGTRLAAGAVLVSEVRKDGPAGAVLQPGDLIVTVDGHPVASRADLNARLAARKPGDASVVGYDRKGAGGQATVTSRSLPADAGAAAIEGRLGIAVAPAGGGLGVTIASATGSWTAARLRVGDVIVAVDGQPVADVAGLAAALARALTQHRGAALFTVRRGQYQGHVEVEL